MEQEGRSVEQEGRSVEHAALLVIDMQEALVGAAHERGAVLEKTGALLRRARAAGAPVVYTQHDHASYEPMMPGSPGWRISEEIAPTGGDLVVRKRSADPFWGTDLEAELRSRGVERVVVTGIATEYCVDSTSRAALSLGFGVTLVADAHTTVDRGGALSPERVVAHHNETLGSLEHPGGGIAVVPEAEVAFAPRG